MTLERCKGFEALKASTVPTASPGVRLMERLWGVTGSGEVVHLIRRGRLMVAANVPKD